MYAIVDHDDYAYFSRHLSRSSKATTAELAFFRLTAQIRWVIADHSNWSPMQRSGHRSD